MWFFFAVVLVCYMLGFLIYCCYNTNKSKNNNPSAPSGNSLSTLRPDGSVTTTLCCANNATILVPGSRPINPQITCLYNVCETQRNSDLPQSVLAAQREQQLRQIKLEINELSQRLGIGQLYRERQLFFHLPRGYTYVPVPQNEEALQVAVDMRSPHPSRSSTRTNVGGTRHRTISIARYCNINGMGPRGQELLNDTNDEVSLSPPSPNSSSSPTHTSDEDEDEATTTSCHSLLPLSSSSTGTITAAGTPVVVGGNNAAGSRPPRPGQGQTFTLSESRNEIFIQRQRRLRLMRMEIEELTLQLSLLSEDPSTTNNAAGCSISSSDLEGLISGQDTDDDDNDLSGLNLNPSTFSYQGELPSYESIIVDPEVDFQRFNESPPPSYAQCTATSATFTSTETCIPKNQEKLEEKKKSPR